MGFFKEFKDDISQAVNELVPEDMFDDNEVVNTLEESENTDTSDISNELNSDNSLIDDFDEDTIDKDILDAILKQEENDKNAKADVIVETVNDIKEETKKEIKVEEKKQMDKKVNKDMNEEDLVDSEVKRTDEVTTITKGTTLNGSISSDGSLDVMGTINGDVECQGKLSIYGTVTGNCMASEVFVGAKRLEGSISSEGSVKIGLGTVIIGDITASAGVIAGAIKGEIDINGPVVIDSSAVIKGNIKAQSIQVNNGAVVEGFCSLAYADIDIDNIFE